jgi:hypothetical protein
MKALIYSLLFFISWSATAQQDTVSQLDSIPLDTIIPLTPQQKLEKALEKLERDPAL